ncbi:MAG: hypothetical protein C0506_11310 [Anaerolinea sp.]|nr:hypothetical protein [Anaerolinea sp.]
MKDTVYYIPVLTTVLSLAFALAVFQRYRSRDGAPYLLWWAAGIFLFGVGTSMEGFTALFGWNEGIFRSWYISGALLGGAPLAQGTVYLLLSRKTADRLSVILVTFIAIAAIMVLLTPVNAQLADDKKLSGDVIEWTWVRAFSPFINTYAFIFLVGGAAYSALKYRERGDAPGRVWGNALICVGALLPGIGGSFTRMGYTEVLYVTEFVGIILIYFGYRFNVRGRPAGTDSAQRAEAPAPA